MKTTIFILLMFLAVSGLAQPIQRTSWTTNAPNLATLDSSGAIISTTLSAKGITIIDPGFQSSIINSAIDGADPFTQVSTDDSLGAGTYQLTVHEGGDINGQQGKYRFGHNVISAQYPDNHDFTNSFYYLLVIGGENSPLAELYVTNGIFMFTGVLSGSGAGLTNIPAAGISTNGSAAGQVLLSSGGVTIWGTVPASDLPGTVVTNNNSGAVTQVIAGTNSFKGSITISNTIGVATAVVTNNLTVGGTISGNGSGLTNGFQNTFTKTNFLLATFFTNTTTRTIQVVGNARCNPTTTGNAIFRLLIDPTGSGTFSITNQAGLEADVIFTTAPHQWSTASGFVPSGGRYEFIDVSGEGLVTMTNSYFQTFQ